MAKQIDLDPNKYRVQRRDGSWTYRDTLGAYVIGLVIALGILGYVWWTRNDGTRDSLFGFTALIAAGTGGLIVMIARRFDRDR